MRQTGDTPLSPYRGLEPFDEGDAPFFFGRERETRLITASLFASPLTLLYGASGVGKSSVLRAGVLPRLRQRSDLLPVVFPTIAREGQTESGSSVVLRGWQTDPLGGLKETIALALFESAAEDRESYGRFRDAVLRAEMRPLREFLAACHEVSERRIMVILDQFEEYSLYHPEDDAFAEQLPAAVTVRDLSVSFLISLREDALAKLDRFKGRIATLWDSYRRVEHLDRAAAEDAIRLPLREYNRVRAGEPPIQIEDSLVSAVLDDVQTERVQFDETGSGTLGSGADEAGGRIETPYLQLVMMRLWEREQAERSVVLRASTLQDEGGAAEIVRTHLDRVMDQFSDEERDIAARMFHRLVTPSGAKIAFSVRDLAQYETIEPERLAGILRRLEEGSRRILRRVADRSGAADEPRYEIFHDRLGKAILAWRAKRMVEHERERKQREEAEQNRLAAETAERYRYQVDAAMDKIGHEGRAIWARIMFYLISTDGRRLIQSASELAEHSQTSREAITTVVSQLQTMGILRVAELSTGDREETAYEVVHDGFASALLNWHSKYVLAQTRAGRHGPPRAAEEVSRAAAQDVSHELPYLARGLLAGRVVPFLGAGVSMSAREGLSFVPSSRQIKEILARECGFPPAELEMSSTAEVASFYAHRLSRDVLDDRLHEILGRPDYKPSDTHRFLAEVARQTPLTILTTNYDTLMEQALDEVGQSYEVLAYVADTHRREWFAVYSPGSPELRFEAGGYFPPDRTVVVRVHGPAITKGGRVGSYVLTEEDQIEWLLNVNTRDEGRQSLPRFVVERLSRSHLLSLGHSAGDWTQRALLRMLARRQNERLRSWAVALNPAPLSIMTWQRYEVKVLNMDLNEWAARMRETGAA